MSAVTAAGLLLAAALAAGAALDALHRRRAARRTVPPCGCGGDHRDPIPYDRIPRQRTTSTEESS